MKRDIIFIILSVKICIVVFIFLCFSLLPFNAPTYFANFTYPIREQISLVTSYKTWDAQHYLYISEKGYHKNDESNAFSPLLPFIIFLTTLIVRNSFVAGMVLANVFSCIGFYLFYLLIKNQYNEKIAKRSLLLLLAFPTSFYFSLIYTESLFFLLVILFFLFLQEKKLVRASLVAFFLPLTRLIGVAILIPFFFSYILEYSRHSFYDEMHVIGKTVLQKKTLFLFLPIFGLILAMIIYYITAGSLFAQFSAQQNFVSHYSFFSLFNPLFFLKALFTFPLHIHGFTDSLLDRLFFFSFVVSLFFMRKRVSAVYFVYSLCFGLLPVLGGSFMSYTRYLVIIFPLFVCLSIMSYEKKYETITFPYLYISLLLQGLFLVMHSLNYWVA